MKSQISLIALFISFLFILSCSKTPNTTNNNDDNISEEHKITDLVIPNNFNWEAITELKIQINARDVNNLALEKVIVKAYTDFPENGGLLMITGITNANGYFETNWAIPSNLTEIVLATEHIGLISATKVPIIDNLATYTFGGPRVQLKSSSGAELKSFKNTKAATNPTNAIINFLGTYNNNGLPNYLENPGDIIDGAFNQDINNTLPSGSSLSQHHPEYLMDTYEHDLLISCQSDVWVTFVHEGAGFRNILGFYTYDLSSPPANTNEIDTITIIFPNASYRGSGGMLQSGDKVKIGNFSENTGIGWVLFADGWTGQEVTDGRHIFYSNKDFNPESDKSIRQHSVLLNDPGRNVILLGFEDLMRDNTSIYNCDHDFNDCIFYITTNPIPCTILDLPIVDYNATDDDNDGIPNSFDDYPNNSDLAFNNYFPCEVTYGTLAYEDLYPGRGDYDFNDLVLEYYFNQITNGENKIKKLEAKFLVKAQGATLHNGFGVQLPIDPSNISSVSGQSIRHNYITLNSNGTEANQSKAVIIAFDDTYDILPHPGGSIIGVNTVPNSPYITPQSVDLSIEFNDPISHTILGTPPYDPFLIIGQERGKEVHLPDYAPTDLFDESYFGTLHDNSIPENNRYFKTNENLPWAIHILRNFDYPIEKAEIITAHLKFSAWAESGGSQFSDWYENKDDYRNDANIFVIPN